MSYITKLGHVSLPNLDYSWFTHHYCCLDWPSCSMPPLPVPLKKIVFEQLLKWQSVPQTEMLKIYWNVTLSPLFFQPWTPEWMFLQTRVMYYTHPSGKEPTAKSRDLMSLPCVAVKVGKLDFLSSPPEQVGLQREAWNASPPGGRRRSAAVFQLGSASASRNRRDSSVPFLILFIVQKCCPVPPQHPLCGCQCSQTHNPCLFLWPLAFFSQVEALDIGFNRSTRHFNNWTALAH